MVVDGAQRIKKRWGCVSEDTDSAGIVWQVGKNALSESQSGARIVWLLVPRRVLTVG